MNRTIISSGVVKQRGALPYGYRLNGQRPAIDGPRAQVVRRIFKDYIAGQSCLRIANKLTEQEISAPRGKQWSPSSVLSIILNDTYAGRCNYSVKELSAKRNTRAKPSQGLAHFPAIVEENLWDEAQRQRSAHSKFAARNSKRVYLLKSLIKCGDCGSALVGHTVVANGKEYRYYRCVLKKSLRSCRNTEM